MSDPITHDRVCAAFLEVRDLPPDEALRRLQAIEEPHLREEVRSLLEFDVRGVTATPHTAGPPLGAQHTTLATPTRIGPYTIVERLGHGGSGVVLLAQQEKPVRRKVAIKIVPYAAISPDFAARFEFERRALERTNHPNIARILDAGRTPEGLPYLVMEYVEGEPITSFCRRHWLTLPAAIDLVLQVADAVQHAHQRGVIHRDLKPANILVEGTKDGSNGGTEQAGGDSLPRSAGPSSPPRAKVLDFGISKPTADAPVTEAPPTSALPMGTPGYMAPEQTGGQPIDTRADVYALAAVLYELTCGRPPVEPGPDALDTLRRLREQVPFPASRVRKARGAPQTPTFGQPGRALLADLDCILAKALEKEPARRYQTMAALGDDLKRLLRHEPIEARPPAVSYRAIRFAQRNRALVATAAVAALALILGIGGLIGGLIEARRQQEEAVNQSRAQAEINRFLNDDLLAQASPQQAGDKVTAIELLDRASRTVEERFPDRPLTAAAIHNTLGTAYMELAAFDKARAHLARALDLRREHAGEDAPDTIRSQAAFASLLVRQEKYDQGEPMLAALLPRARQILGEGSPALYAILNDLGSAETALSKGKDAIAHLSEALAGRRRLLGEKDPTVLTSMTNLAQALDSNGDTQASLDMDLKALALAGTIEEPNRFLLIGLNNNIGATYQDLNQDEKAAPYLRKAAALANDFLGPDNPDTLSLQANLASLEAELGDPAKAMELYDAVVKARTRVLGPDAQDTLVGRYGYCNAAWIAKRYDDAAAGLKSLLSDMARVLGDKHFLTIQTKAHLALALAGGGHDREALPYATEAVADFTALYGEKHARTINAAATLEGIQRRLSAPKPDPGRESRS